MSASLVPCTACSRHIRASEEACPFCSAELKSLRDSITHFRDASASYARQEFAQSYAQRSSIAPPHSFLTQPLYWTAAAVVFVAALFPLSMRWQHHPASPVPASSGSASVQSTESDEDLLADIDQKVSADVPSAMAPLADPTAGSASSTSGSRRSPTASGTASCTCGRTPARCSGPPASPRSCERGARAPVCHRVHAPESTREKRSDDATTLGHHRPVRRCTAP